VAAAPTPALARGTAVRRLLKLAPAQIDGDGLFTLEHSDDSLAATAHAENVPRRFAVIDRDRLPLADEVAFLQGCHLRVVHPVAPFGRWVHMECVDRTGGG
jgi:hypothetical protein